MYYHYSIILFEQSHNRFVFVFCSYFWTEKIRIRIWLRILYSCYTGQQPVAITTKYMAYKVTVKEEHDIRRCIF